jgi:hypothetical protein
MTLLKRMAKAGLSPVEVSSGWYRIDQEDKASALVSPRADGKVASLAHDFGGFDPNTRILRVFDAEMRQVLDIVGEVHASTQEEFCHKAEQLLK